MTRYDNTINPMIPNSSFSSHVEIFRTNITNTVPADICVLVLSEYFPNASINFDLEDQDRILRIEDRDVDVLKITEIVKDLGIYCELLEG